MTRIRRRIPVYRHVAQPMTDDDYLSPTLADIQALARSRTETAIHVLSSIMVRETATPLRVWPLQKSCSIAAGASRPSRWRIVKARWNC